MGSSSSYFVTKGLGLKFITVYSYTVQFGIMSIIAAGAVV